MRAIDEDWLAKTTITHPFAEHHVGVDAAAQAERDVEDEGRDDFSRGDVVGDKLLRACALSADLTMSADGPGGLQ